MTDKCPRCGVPLTVGDDVREVIRDLRKALAHYADPEEGWDSIAHADAYEASRELVPFDAEETADNAWFARYAAAKA